MNPRILPKRKASAFADAFLFGACRPAPCKSRHEGDFGLELRQRGYVFYPDTFDGAVQPGGAASRNGEAAPPDLRRDREVKHEIL